MAEENLGAWLKAKRLAASLSLRQAALAAGVDHARLMDLERGVDRNTGKPTRPRRETLERLAIAYNLGLDVVSEAAGLGAPAPVTDPELQAMLDLFRQLTRDERRLALSLVRVLVDARKDAASL